MAREYFHAYHSFLQAMEPLNDAERGRLFTACLIYSKTGEALELRGNERFVFPGIRSQIDRDDAKYETKCEINRKNGSMGGKRSVSDGSERPPNAPQGKGKDKGKDKGKGKDEDEGRADARAAAASDYLNRVNPMASQSCLEELMAYSEAMGADVCKRAVDTALDSKKADWPYIRGILQRLQTQGVQCIADWDRLEEEYRQKKERGSGGTGTNAGAVSGKNSGGWNLKSDL